MNIKHLRHFVGIASAGALTVASERLYLTQSALSRSVAELERFLECKLFERSRRGMAMTVQGAVLLPIARRIVLEVDALQGELTAQSKDPRGHVRLAMPTGVRDRLTRPLVQLLRKRHPGIQLDVSEGTARNNREAVLNGLADLGVTTANEESVALLHSTRLYSDRLCIVGPQSAGLSLSVALPAICLVGKPLLLIPSPNNIRALVDKALRRLRCVERPVMEAGSSPLLLGLVEDGNGFTVLPASTIASAVAERRVSAAPIAGMSLTWVLVVPRERLVPHCVRLTAEALKEVNRRPAGVSLTLLA